MSDFENHLKIIVGAGERTRGILYFLGLVFAALLAFVAESDLFPWTEIRYDKMSKAFLCYTENIKSDENVPSPTFTSPIVSPQEPCKDFYSYIENYYLYIHPKKFPEDHKFTQSWDAIFDRYKLLAKEYVEGASISIPVVGLKMDRNNVFLFSSVIMAIILMTLKLSMQNESKCIQDAIDLKIVKSKSDAYAIINSHVFAKSRGNEKWFWWFLFGPSILVATDLGKSAIDSISTDFGLPSLFMSIFYLTQALSLAVLVFVNILCYKSARSLDRQLEMLSAKFA